MVRKAWMPPVLLLSLPLLLGMGFGDSQAPTRIPEPQSNYRVTLVDQEGVRVELTEFSVDGQTFVMGGLGQGQVAVPLEKVKAVDIVNQDGKLKAKISLSQGEPVSLNLDGNLKVTGRTSYGNFRIPLSEVRRVEVKELVR